MEAWLRCTLYPGQFSSELAVVVKSYHGRQFSLFAQKSDLQFDLPPTRDLGTEGWIRVDLVKRAGPLFLIGLPQSTLENGQYLTVTADQFRDAPSAAPIEFAQ